MNTSTRFLGTTGSLRLGNFRSASPITRLIAPAPLGSARVDLLVAAPHIVTPIPSTFTRVQSHDLPLSLWQPISHGGIAGISTHFSDVYLRPHAAEFVGSEDNRDDNWSNAMTTLGCLLHDVIPDAAPALLQSNRIILRPSLGRAPHYDVVAVIGFSGSGFGGALGVAAERSLIAGHGGDCDIVLCVCWLGGFAS